MNADAARARIARFASQPILIVGDVMLDQFLFGTVERISPEAPVPVVLVSEEVGAGVVPQTQAGRVFRDALGTLNQRLAAAAEEVVLVVAGLPLTLKAPTPSSPTDPWSAP